MALTPDHGAKWLASPPVARFLTRSSRTSGLTIFFTRTWNPEEAKTPAEAEERRTMNHSRAELIRALKQALADRFAGGFQPDGYATAMYPDCLADSHTYEDKAAYLRTAAEATVCVGSRGLYDSVGWKTGEYVALGRAVVCETIEDVLPGQFGPASNYLAFEGPGECVSRVSELREDDELRQHMMRANEAYWRSYLRPDLLVAHTLVTALRSNNERPNSGLLDLTDCQQYWT
jgi:hypothetical protein